MKVKFDKLLKNKILLYVVFLIALFTIFNFIYKQNYHAALFFILVAFLVRYFSNNMIIILGISIIATYLLDLFRVFSIGYLEGVDESLNGTTDKAKGTTDKAKGTTDKTKGTTDKTNGTAESSDDDTYYDTDDDPVAAKNNETAKGRDNGSNIEKPSSKKINFTNMKLNPANIESKQGSGNLKQADVKELAYDNLEKLLSSDQVRVMSSDAKALTDKQNQIMSQLKDMTPMVNQALKFLKDFDMSTVHNMGDKLEGAIDTLQNMKSQ